MPCYGIGGKLVAEFDGSTGVLKKEYIYGASGLVATIVPNAQSGTCTQYTTTDSLGSPRVVTNSSAAVVSRHDYMPFGDEIGSGATTQNPSPVTFPSGTVTDIFAKGTRTTSLVTRQQAGNTIVSILSTPTTTTQTQRLFIVSPTSGVAAIARYQRTLSNVDAQGNLRPFVNPQTMRTISNFKITFSRS